MKSNNNKKFRTKRNKKPIQRNRTKKNNKNNRTKRNNKGHKRRTTKKNVRVMRGGMFGKKVSPYKALGTEKLPMTPKILEDYFRNYRVMQKQTYFTTVFGVRKEKIPKNNIYSSISKLAGVGRPDRKLYTIYNTNNLMDEISNLKKEINSNKYDNYDLKSDHMNKLENLLENLKKYNVTSNKRLNRDDVLIIFSESQEEFIIAKIMEVNKNSFKINPYNFIIPPHPDDTDGFYISLNKKKDFKYLFLFNENAIDPVSSSGLASNSVSVSATKRKALHGVKAAGGKALDGVKAAGGKALDGAKAALRSRISGAAAGTRTMMQTAKVASGEASVEETQLGIELKNFNQTKHTADASADTTGAHGSPEGQSASAAADHHEIYVNEKNAE